MLEREQERRDKEDNSLNSNQQSNTLMLSNSSQNMSKDCYSDSQYDFDENDLLSDEEFDEEDSEFYSSEYYDSSYTGSEEGEGEGKGGAVILSPKLLHIKYTHFHSTTFYYYCSRIQKKGERKRNNLLKDEDLIAILKVDEKQNKLDEQLKKEDINIWINKMLNEGDDFLYRLIKDSNMNLYIDRVPCLPSSLSPFSSKLTQSASNKTNVIQTSGGGRIVPVECNLSNMEVFHDVIYNKSNKDKRKEILTYIYNTLRGDEFKQVKVRVIFSSTFLQDILMHKIKSSSE